MQGYRSCTREAESADFAHAKLVTLKLQFSLITEKKNVEVPAISDAAGPEKQ